MEEKIEKDFTSKIIDKIFNIKKTTFYLIFILILGFILRLIAAINLGVAADDMHFVTQAVNFYSSGRLVTYDQSSGLWFAFTSVIYKLFGMTQLTSRFAALLFGSLSVIPIYLLAKEFFDEKIALFSAFLLAISPFHIKSTVAEMDVMAMFFVLLGMLLFVRGLKANNTKNYIFSGMSMGLAIYTKVYPLLFLPSLILYSVYFRRKEKKDIISKENIKKIFVFLLAVFIFCIPALTHNYLLYKDKGFLDLQFTRTLGLGKNISEKYYGWDYQFNAKNDWKGLILGNSFHRGSQGPPLILEAINIIRVNDPVNFYAGLLGLGILFFFKKRYKDYILFFICGILFALPYLASIILLEKHYLFLSMLLIPGAALGIRKANDRFSVYLKMNLKIIIIAILFVISLIILGLNIGQQPYYAKSYIGQIIDFKKMSIPENALIVADSRIYRGRVNWIFQERAYLEGADFINIINRQNEIPGNSVSADIYYFECVVDDCGWGTVKDQADFNSSMESLTSFFRQGGEHVKTIKEPSREKPYFPFTSENSKKDTINVYRASLSIKDSILAIANQPKNWFLYDIGYIPKEKQFDYYEKNGFFDSILDRIAHWIVLLSIILTFLSPVFIVYILIKDDNINNSTSI